MKLIFLLAAMVAAALARPQEPPLAPGVVPILDYHLEYDEFGQYFMSYVSGDGTKVSQQGALVPSPKGDGSLIYVLKGAYSYFSPDGTPIEETWTADADGFHPEGKHLPTTPSPDAAAAVSLS